MTMRGSRWQVEKDLVTDERPKVAIDRFEIRETGEGVFEITLEGQGLHGAINPPRVEVGGSPVTALKFEQDGRVLKGIVRERPRSRTVTVDYGFARAKAEL